MTHLRPDVYKGRSSTRASPSWHSLRQTGSTRARSSCSRSVVLQRCAVVLQARSVVVQAPALFAPRVETRRRSTAAVTVRRALPPRVPPQCAHRRRAAAGRQGGVAGVAEGIGARDARYVAAARRGRDRGAGAARLSADRGVGWPGGDWGVEGVRLGLCHWAGLGLRWEQRSLGVGLGIIGPNSDTTEFRIRKISNRM